MSDFLYRYALALRDSLPYVAIWVAAALLFGGLYWLLTAADGTEDDEETRHV